MARYGIQINPSPNTFFSLQSFGVYLKSGSEYTIFAGNTSVSNPLTIWRDNPSESVYVQFRATNATPEEHLVTSPAIDEDITIYSFDYKQNGVRLSFTFTAPAPDVMEDVQVYMTHTSKLQLEDIVSGTPLICTRENTSNKLFYTIFGDVEGAGKFFHFTYHNRPPITNTYIEFQNQTLVNTDIDLHPVYGSLSISSIPEGATITLVSIAGTNNVYTTPHTFPSLEVFDYTITLSKYGYFNTTVTLPIEEGRVAIRSYTLSPNPAYHGVLTTTISPPLTQQERILVRNGAGSIVAENIEIFTITGLGNLGVFNFFRPGYIPLRNVPLTISAPLSISYYPLSFTRCKSKVTFTSSPSGAEIWIDGNNTTKVTPSTIEVSGGNRNVVLKKPGYFNDEGNLYIGYSNEIVDTTYQPEMVYNKSLSPLTGTTHTITLRNPTAEEMYVNVAPIYHHTYHEISDGASIIDSQMSGTYVENSTVPIYRKIILAANATQDLEFIVPDAHNPDNLYFFCESWGTCQAAMSLKQEILPPGTYEFECHTERITCDVTLTSYPTGSNVFVTYVPPGNIGYVEETHQFTTPVTLEGVDANISIAENRHLEYRARHHYRFERNGFIPIHLDYVPEVDKLNDIYGDFSRFGGWLEIFPIPSSARIYDEQGILLNDPTSGDSNYKILSGVNVRRRFVLKHETKYDTVAYYKFTGSPGGTQSFTTVLCDNAVNLTIQSTPPGARIYLDEWDTGEVTPHTFEQVPVGSRPYVLDLPDYNKASGTITVNALGEDILDVTLNKIFQHRPTINGETQFF